MKFSRKGDVIIVFNQPLRVPKFIQALNQNSKELGEKDRLQKLFELSEIDPSDIFDIQLVKLDGGGPSTAQYSTILKSWNST